MAGPLVGALLVSTPVFAQVDDAPRGEITRRIEATFELVLGNSAELAVPLTRRALARRMNETRDEGVAPLAYGASENAEDGQGDAMASPLDEGSADASADEESVRLPRPRPSEAVAAAVPDVGTGSVAAPLDLVASAADAGPDAVVVAAGEPVADLALARPEAEGEAPAPGPAEVADAGAPPELVASRSCLSPEDVSDKDGDFRRNAEVLSDSGFCIGQETFKERRRGWTIETVKTNRPGPLFALMHDDEDMSFDNAVAALRLYGGTLVAVETGGKRNQDGVDPNRNFSAGGLGCRKLGDDAAPKFTAFFRDLLDADQPVIALHNNTGERIPTGGLGHVSMDDVPKDMEPRDSVDPDGPLAGERTLVLLTSPVPVTATSRARADALAARGINAVVEPVKDGGGDCSLSNYTVLIGHSDYFNVTVDKGEAEKQMRIIDEILGKPAQTVATQ